eukprot:172075-Prorocentrum_minimum.AAC.1
MTLHIGAHPRLDPKQPYAAARCRAADDRVPARAPRQRQLELQQLKVTQCAPRGLGCVGFCVGRGGFGGAREGSLGGRWGVDLAVESGRPEGRSRNPFESFGAGKQEGMIRGSGVRHAYLRSQLDPLIVARHCRRIVIAVRATVRFLSRLGIPNFKVDWLGSNQSRQARGHIAELLGWHNQPFSACETGCELS